MTSIKEIGISTPTVEQIRDMAGLIPYATVVVDRKGEIVIANQLVEPLFGYRPGELIGRNIDVLLPGRFRDRHAQHRAGYMASPVTRPMDGRLELVGSHQEGREFPVEVALSPLDSQEGLLVLSTIRDITRRKKKEKELLRSQQQLRELAARLLAVSEVERARISRTIHDELGQMMTGLKMDLAWLQMRLGSDQGLLVDKTKAMSELIDASIQAIRQISTELRPGILDEIGLEAAVEWQLQEFQRRTDIHCTLTSNLTERALDITMATVTFRILQEVLTNVARHALATQVEVTLEETESELRLFVHDNGRGITGSEINDPRSIGLLGMHERVRPQAGELQISGSVGEGTTVFLRLPRSNRTGTVS